jgi:hypothetical protein
LIWQDVDDGLFFRIILRNWSGPEQGILHPFHPTTRGAQGYNSSEHVLRNALIQDRTNKQPSPPEILGEISDLCGLAYSRIKSAGIQQKCLRGSRKLMGDLLWRHTGRRSLEAAYRHLFEPITATWRHSVPPAASSEFPNSNRRPSPISYRTT